MFTIDNYPSGAAYVPNIYQTPNTYPSSYTYSYPQLSNADVERIAAKIIEILEANGVVFAMRAEDV